MDSYSGQGLTNPYACLGRADTRTRREKRLRSTIRSGCRSLLGPPAAIGLESLTTSASNCVFLTTNIREFSPSHQFHVLNTTLCRQPYFEKPGRAPVSRCLRANPANLGTSSDPVRPHHTPDEQKQSNSDPSAPAKQPPKMRNSKPSGRPTASMKRSAFLGSSPARQEPAGLSTCTAPQ